jgi:site-specific DNA recombinase
MRVDGYARVSTEEQATDGVSLDAQMAKIRGYAELYDLELCEVVVDGGVSAKTLLRPGWATVEGRLRSGEVEGVIVAKLDRLTRSLADWSYLIDTYFGERVRHPRRLFSVNDSIDTRHASGRLVLNVLMSVAQWEREIIAERTRDALAHKIGRGERVGKVRYGHSLGDDGKTLVPDPAQLAALDMMRGWRDQGRSLAAICDLLRENGILTAEGLAVWSPMTVGRLLKRIEGGTNVASRDPAP